MTKNVDTIPSTIVPISGKWRTVQVKGVAVNVEVTISDSYISYKYCNGKNMKYDLSGGNLISVAPGISTMMACLNLKPVEGDFDNAFI